MKPKAQLQYRAWTGGSSPAEYETLERVEAMLVRLIFRHMCRVYSDYWKEEADCDIRRRFWNQSRYDAHATMREAGPTRTEDSIRLICKDLENVA